MKITPAQNGGPLPYDKSKCPAALRSFRFALGLGPQMPDGRYLCHAWSPQEKPKNPVQSFLFDPDAAPGQYFTIFQSHSTAYLSQNTITSPLDVLFGERLEEKLQEMYQDGYAAWN